MKLKAGKFLLLLVIVFACNPPVEQVVDVIPIPVISEPEPTLLFGIPIDDRSIFESKVRWSQTLSGILEEFNVSRETIHEMAIQSRQVYDVRKIKAGTRYTIIHLPDSLRSACQLVYEPDDRSYVIYNFEDSVYVNKVEKEVKVVEKSVSAEIKTSVYEAVLESGASPMLVSKLVDMFAWQVDFFRIQKGDRFKVIYEEEQVDGKEVGIRKIVGAHFKHFDKDYYGIFYETKDGKKDYFDENGNSLRKTFLRAPLNYRRISSRFTTKRFHPVLKRYKAHLGTDYAANPGTPIRTVGDGVIEEARFHRYNGNFVKIRHNSNYSTQYLHMQKIKRGIRPGIVVKQGETIGYVGSTGLANGPHLCFRFWKNGRQVDALSVDLPPSEPISTSQLNSYTHQKNVILHKLNLLQLENKEVLMANVGGQP